MLCYSDMGKHASSRGSKEPVDLIGKIAASQVKSLANKKNGKFTCGMDGFHS